MSASPHLSEPMARRARGLTLSLMGRRDLSREDTPLIFRWDTSLSSGKFADDVKCPIHENFIS